MRTYEPELCFVFKDIKPPLVKPHPQKWGDPTSQGSGSPVLWAVCGEGRVVFSKKKEKRRVKSS